MESPVCNAGETHSALVVDDDPGFRVLMCHMLADIGIRDVRVAANAAEALQCIRDAAEPLSMIFCDLHMPDSDGVDLLRQLGSVSARSALVIVSGAHWRILRSAELLAQRSRLNYCGAVTKPVDRAELHTVVANIVADWDTHSLPRPQHMPGPRSRAWVEEALADDRITIHVQPQIEVATGRLHGVEVLARGFDPGGALVAPAQFIDTAEREGLIDALTFRILDKTELAIAAWRRQGIDPKVAVNVSATTLSRHDLPERLAQSPELSNVVVELTESAVAEQLEDLLAVTTRLRLRGLELSIDDFGTGYSTLSQLDVLPFSELKLDQSFVRPAIRESGPRSIITNIVHMAHDLGMVVVAEGVETAEHYAMIESMDCDVAQGYYVARPMPWDALPDWVDGQARALASPLARPTGTSGRPAGAHARRRPAR